MFFEIIFKFNYTQLKIRQLIFTSVAKHLLLAPLVAAIFSLNVKSFLRHLSLFAHQVVRPVQSKALPLLVYSIAYRCSGS